MSEFLSAYGLFLLQTLTVVLAVVALLAVAGRLSQGAGEEGRGQLKVTDLSARIDQQQEQISKAIEGFAPQDKKSAIERLKARIKTMLSKTPKAANDEPESVAGSTPRPTACVIEFKGDMKASQVQGLRNEVSAILAMKPRPDRVLIKLTSPGGLVHMYGLASSQLARLRDAGIELTVAVDTVAASGGYMMAVCAQQIVAAPFAVLGSIGVVAQVPNLHRFLKGHDVDVELHTAGAHKRTLTVLGENTPEGRRKFKEDLEHTHALFKDWIATRRPQLDVESVSDGSIFYGADAIEKGLCDRIATSDDVIEEWHQTHHLIGLHWHEKKSLAARLGRDTADALVDRVEHWASRSSQDFTRL